MGSPERYGRTQWTMTATIYYIVDTDSQRLGYVMSGDQEYWRPLTSLAYSSIGLHRIIVLHEILIWI
jgi:hypothetical protein